MNVIPPKTLLKNIKWLKEGYFFRVNEITLIFSHEFFITILAVYSVIAYTLHRVKQK